MNISERLNAALSVNFGLSELNKWVLKNRYQFSLSELKDVWSGRNCTMELKLIKSCYNSAGVTLNLRDSSSGFDASFILNDDEALSLMSGQKVNFRNVDILYQSEIPEVEYCTHYYSEN